MCSVSYEEADAESEEPEENLPPIDPGLKVDFSGTGWRLSI